MQNEILECLASHGAVHSARSLRSADRIEEYELVVRVAGRTIELLVEMAKPFGLYAPRFRLKDHERLGLVAHVVPKGYVCYMQDEGVLLDPDNYTGVLKYCLDRVVETLEDSLTGAGQQDLINEFQSYWGIESPYRVWSSVSITSEPRDVFYAHIADNAFVASDSVPLLTKGIAMLRGHGRPDQVRRALYVPLERPFLPRTPKTLDEMRRLIYDHMSKDSWTRLRTIASGMCVDITRPDLLIFSVPAPNESFAVGSILLTNFSEKNKQPARHREHRHWILQGGLKAKIEAIPVIRCDRDHLLRRTSGDTSLNRFHVVVAGCGAVGGIVAQELARAGIGRLTLVDPDKLVVDNIYRHVLGAVHLYNDKASALKREIESRWPYCDVEACNLRIEDWLATGVPKNIDLVVVALGNPTIELYLNRLFRKQSPSLPVVYTWVEPYGIGGHALLVHGNVRGCLECLYSDPQDPEAELYNRASFAAGGQYFGQTVSGCGSAFTPYAGLDAMQAAVVATRLSIDALLGRESGNPLLSWKGATDTFEKRYRLSARTRMSPDDLFEQRYAYALDNCPVCGGG